VPGSAGKPTEPTQGTSDDDCDDDRDNDSGVRSVRSALRGECLAKLPPETPDPYDAVGAVLPMTSAAGDAYVSDSRPQRQAFAFSIR